MTKPRKREYALMAAALALTMFYWSGGDRPEDRVLQPLAPSALSCTKLHRGQWLRVEVMHRGDVEKLRLECFYGYGGKRFVL